MVRLECVNAFLSIRCGLPADCRDRMSRGGPDSRKVTWPPEAVATRAVAFMFLTRYPKLHRHEVEPPRVARRLHFLGGWGYQPVVKISKRARLDRSPESIIICTLVRMSMGTRRTRRRQEALWVATTDLPQTVAHPFYRRVNALLDAHGFDAFVERQCQRFYAATRGRPSLTPGIYFRLLRRICGSLPSNLRGSDALVF